MEILMRRARRSDGEALNRIFNQEVRDGNSQLDIDEKDLEYRLEWLAEHGKRYPVFVGEWDGEVICWVSLNRYSWHYPLHGIAELSLHIDHTIRDQDLDKALLRFIEQRAVALGYYKLILTVFADNRTALHRYRTAGYRDVGVLRNHGFYKGRLVDLALLERLLAADTDSLKSYYRKRYPFYESFFRREEVEFEAQMLRNGMIRSPQDPTKWIPSGEHSGYQDDWAGETVRVVRDLPPLELPKGYAIPGSEKKEEPEEGVPQNTVPEEKNTSVLPNTASAEKAEKPEDDNAPNPGQVPPESVIPGE